MSVENAGIEIDQFLRSTAHNHACRRFQHDYWLALDRLRRANRDLVETAAVMAASLTTVTAIQAVISIGIDKLKLSTDDLEGAFYLYVGAIDVIFAIGVLRSLRALRRRDHAETQVDQMKTVTYRWERSDGVVGVVQNITFTRPGTLTVRNPWLLSQSFSGWQRLRVYTSNPLLSNLATFYLNCPLIVTGASASVYPPTSNACPQTFYFSAIVTATGAGSATYESERSEGTTTPAQTIILRDLAPK